MLSLRTCALVLVAAVALAAASPSSSTSLSTTLSSLPKTYYTVFYTETTGDYTVESGKDTTGVAYGYYTRAQNQTGWGQLSITTNSSYDTNVQMYGAGYLEGVLTADDIALFWANQGIVLSQGQIDYFSNNSDWLQGMYTANTTNYWQHMQGLNAQVDGMYAGYANTTTSTPITMIEFITLSATGDLETLGFLADNPKKHGRTNPQAQTYGSHCSSLIKLLPDLTDLYAGHTTWTMFTTMYRIYKNYNFDLPIAKASTSVSFSSYPGSIVSIDDFYTIDSGLVVIETTNGFYNESLNQYIQAEGQILSFYRTALANRLATNGEEWTQIFSWYNSGTYNNQWIIVDYNLFTPGVALQPGTLWIVEQIPGATYPHDVTSYLNLGYWPSYNVPFTPEVFEICEFETEVEQYGNALWSYDLCARAKIFRRDQDGVMDLDDFGAIQRYNDWQNDPYSLGNAGLQISSRFDLNKAANASDPFLSQQCFGGTDSKITSKKLMDAGFLAYAQSGPTHDVQPVFEWDTSTACAGAMHNGMPASYPFEWELMDFSGEMNH